MNGVGEKNGGRIEGPRGINKGGWRFFMVVSLYFDDTRYTPNRGGFRRQGGMDRWRLRSWSAFWRRMDLAVVLMGSGDEMRICERRRIGGLHV